jgi:SsrA-binding protein
MSSKSGGTKKTVAKGAARGGIVVKGDNRKARHDYELMETFEAGIELVGSEVKSLRGSSVNLGEAYAAMKGNQLFLINSNIPEYREANRFNHDPKRPRRLLLHRKQIDRLAIGVLREGLTIIPLKLFFNPRGRVKVDVALAKGRQLHDKRENDKKKDWDREKGRLLRDKG